MAPMPTEALLWKLQGNTYWKDGKYLKAIDCYDEALRRVSTEEHGLVLLLNRCQARLSFQHYDAALEDAKAVLEIDPTNEKALFRAARVSYDLGSFARCCSYLAKLKKHYPGNKAAVQEIKRCELRSREQAGEFDFESMLDEAITKQPSPRLDRAAYIGPIEVRKCAIESHGRGLFATEAVKAGQLLLCEKAYATAFAPYDSKAAADINHSNDTSSDGSKWRLKLRTELAASIFIKLIRNTSVVSAFADLYSGPDADEEIDEETNLPVVDSSFIQHRTFYNAFAFPSLTYEFHWKSGHTPDDLKAEESGSIGVWIFASHINHSCYPLVRRTYIGDMMIFRAQADIPADTELKFGYISCLESYKARQKMLKKWGFRCECQVCFAEKDYSQKMVRKRAKITEEIIERFERSTATDLGVYGHCSSHGFTSWI
ncbi:hypothetical protein HO173_006403 [Letharia columbiana]|uniref:SET domain-containing protein n=1 Tax=Letharia columbiana TaxID=112416 RepID=A0A8H6FUU0_9LECA|nr:uncharacterized protein HO173_006403 [Letharia columbiana]KAF6235209.1 hypothetical protein HO173_006403 [Letharia columbiana]